MDAENLWDVIVIGGGPAGMMAAGRAAERGRRVLLLEKNPTVGKKLLITGGGRCNVTNYTLNTREMLSKYKDSSKFLFSPFAQFGVKEALDFFNGRGMETKVEAEGRVFPVSNKAKSVSDLLVQYMKKGGVTVRTNAKVHSVKFDKAIKMMVVSLSGGPDLFAESCVVATGGTSHPETGSTGEGFKWLEKLGHTIIESDASLVPIALKDAWVKNTAGVTLDDVKLTTSLNGSIKKTHRGKLLFTHVGISGPTVLNMSSEVGELLGGNEGVEYLKGVNKKSSAFTREVVIFLDLFPDIDVGALRQAFHLLLTEFSNRKIRNVLPELVAPALVDPIIEISKVNGDTPSHSVRTADRKTLVSTMKAMPLRVAGLLGKDKAIVSSGGAKLSEIDFKTMRSRLVPQLFLVGDTLNIDRPSGGYSLQLCWTTGYVAGNNC